jgi:hypothetical protein
MGGLSPLLAEGSETLAGRSPLSAAPWVADQANAVPHGQISGRRVDCECGRVAGKATGANFKVAIGYPSGYALVATRYLSAIR